MIGRNPNSRYLFLKELIKCMPTKNRLTFWRAILLFIIKNMVTTNIGSPNKYLNTYTIVKNKGILFILNSNISMGSSILSKAFEPNTFDFISKSQGNIFVDVGAYSGVYSLLASKNFSKIIAIEPNPSILPTLKTNIHINNIKNIELLEIAASDSNSKIKLYKGLSTSTYSIKKDYFLRENNGIYFNVVGLRLDKILRNYSYIDLIKIDVEGAELNVLKGLSGVLYKINSIIIETQHKDKQNIMCILSKFESRILDSGDVIDIILFTKKRHT